jgi:hypothetical protein
MIRHPFLLLSLYWLTSSCDKSSRQMPPGEQSLPAQQTAGQESCYLGIMKKDSILLLISSQQQNQVLGELQYKHFEKDSSRGTLQGELRGDTLLAEYKFMSEGTESIRQVAFLRKGADWVEGYGEAEVKNGRMAFKDPAHLNFDDSWTLKKVNCTH